MLANSDDRFHGQRFDSLGGRSHVDDFASDHRGTWFSGRGFGSRGFDDDHEVVTGYDRLYSGSRGCWTGDCRVVGSDHIRARPSGRSPIRRHQHWRDQSHSQDQDMSLSSSQTVSYYFTNIPVHLQFVELKKGFEVCGISFDVFVSQNRNARGQLFGFVRFIKLREQDAEKLNRALNNVYFGNHRVWANIARYDRFGGGSKLLGEGKNISSKEGDT